MRALLAEYAVIAEPSLAPEGAAMLRVLSESFERIGYEIVSPEGGDFGSELRRLAPGCDVGLVIAPDHLLADYTRIIEHETHNLGCGSTNAALCANKKLTARILASHGIAVPADVRDGRKVVKPVQGCGSEGVRLTEDPPGPNEIGQQFIEGEHLSVSLVGSRVVGEACLYYSGQPPLVLAVNRQEIRIDGGRFEYLGGETPVHHPRNDEVVDAAVTAATVMGCQGYAGVDIVLADRPYVVDVNPRVTTSVVGIAACMKEEIADLLVRASRGETVGPVRLSGKATFTKDGRVTRA